MVGPSGKVVAIEHVDELVELSRENVRVRCFHMIEEMEANEQPLSRRDLDNPLMRSTDMKYLRALLITCHLSLITQHKVDLTRLSNDICRVPALSPFDLAPTSYGPSSIC